MARFPSLVGRTGPIGYALAAPPLLVVQPLCVMLICRMAGWTLAADAGFLILPLRRLAVIPMLSAAQAAGQSNPMASTLRGHAGHVGSDQ